MVLQRFFYFFSLQNEITRESFDWGMKEEKGISKYNIFKKINFFQILKY